MPVKTIDYTQTGVINANKGRSTIVSVPSGYLWEFLALKIKVPPIENQNGETPDQSSSGGHYVYIQSERPETQPEYLRLGSDGNDEICINRRSIIRATAHKEPSNDQSLGLALDSIKLDSNEAIQIGYWNETSVDQTKERKWKFRVLERAV